MSHTLVADDFSTAVTQQLLSTRFALHNAVLALCPNTNEVWIFTGCANPDSSKWVKKWTLKEASGWCSAELCQDLPGMPDCYGCKHVFLFGHMCSMTSLSAALTGTR
jgi:hypothetical protein